MTQLAADLNRAMACDPVARERYAAIYGAEWTPLTNADGSISTGYSTHVASASNTARTVI